MKQISFNLKTGVGVVTVRIDSEPSDGPIREWDKAVDERIAETYRRRDVAERELQQEQPTLFSAREEARKLRGQFFGAQHKLGLSGCSYGLLKIPHGIEPQTIAVMVSPGEHVDAYLPLIDSTGKPVTIAVEPGRAYMLPSVVFTAAVKFVSEPGKHFDAQLTVMGEAQTGFVGRAVAVKSSPGQKVSVGPRTGQLFVPETAAAQTVSVFIGDGIDSRAIVHGEKEAWSRATDEQNDTNTLRRWDQAIREEIDVQRNAGVTIDRETAIRNATKTKPDLFAKVEQVRAKQQQQQQHPQPLQLIGEDGTAVSFKVFPGSACTLPASVLVHPAVIFVAEPGKDFDAVLI